MLILKRKVGERIIITTQAGERIVITVVEGRYGAARIGFEADKQIKILRQELEHGRDN